MVRKAAGDGKQTRPQMQRKIDWGTPRAGELGCGNTKHLTSFFPLGPPTCSLRSNATSLQDVKKKKKKVFATCIFPRVFRFSFTELFPFDDYTFTAFPLLIYHLYCPAFYCPRHPLSRDGKKVQSENKWRNGDKRKQHNDTQKKEWNDIKRWIWITKRRKDEGKWKERSASFSLYNLFHIRSFYHQTSWILLDDVQCSLSNTHILPIDF